MSSSIIKSYTGRSKKKILIILIPLVLLAMLCSGYIVASQIKAVYQVAYNGETIGEASSPEKVKQWFQAQEDNFISRYPDIQYETNEDAFSFIEMKRFNAKAQDEAIMEALQKRYVIEGKGVQIDVDGQVMGIVKDQKTANEILNQIQEPYSNSKSNLKIEALSNNTKENKDNQNNSSSQPSLKSIDFVEQVEVNQIVTDPSKIITDTELIERLKGTDLKPVKYVVQAGDCVSCIAQKFNISQEVIYKNNTWIVDDFINIGDELDLTVIKPKLSVKTEEEYSETVTVSSGVETTYDETLRVGISKVIDPGKAGKKKITYLVSKINGEIMEETVVSTETLEKAIPKKVIQGSKIIKGVGTGNFEWPITEPTITSKFGKRWGRLHAGTDAISSDLNIYASDHGKVKEASYNSSYGNYVIIDHQNGYQTVYMHLSEHKVEEGDILEKGDPLGVMGTTGRSTGVHLHFEIRKGESRLNPMEFLE